jgi:hypothetical protein
MGTSAQLNFHPQFVVSNVGSDLYTLSTLLKANTNALTNGMVTDGYIPIPTDTSNSWVQLFQKVNQQYNNNVQFDGNVEFGMATAYTFVQVLQRAGKDVNRGNIIAAIEKGGLSGPGLVPLDFSGTNHQGYMGTRVVKVSNGTATFTGPAYTTDDGNGPLTEVTQQQPTAPANGIPSS